MNNFLTFAVQPRRHEFEVSWTSLLQGMEEDGQFPDSIYLAFPYDEYFLPVMSKISKDKVFRTRCKIAPSIQHNGHDVSRDNQIEDLRPKGQF